MYYDNRYGITTIDAQYIRPGVASFHLMIEGGRAAFFDTGTTRSLERALGALKRKGLGPDDVDFVVPTHVHLDHAGGAGAMMRTFSNARLIVHPRGAEHLVDPTRLWAGTVGVYGLEAAEELYGEVVPVERQRMILATDAWELDFRGRPLLFVDTPGHARHHFCVIDVRHRAMFTGDTLGVSYRAFDGPGGPFVFPTTSPVQFEPEPLHQSIDRLMGYAPEVVYLAHFGSVRFTRVMADALHRQIDAFTDIADSCSGGGGDHAELTRRVADYMLGEARRHGVPLPDAEIRARLEMDARLNADGLAIWKARR